MSSQLLHQALGLPRFRDSATGFSTMCIIQGVEAGQQCVVLILSTSTEGFSPWLCSFFTIRFSSHSTYQHFYRADQGIFCSPLHGRLLILPICMFCTYFRWNWAALGTKNKTGQFFSTFSYYYLFNFLTLFCFFLPEICLPLKLKQILGFGFQMTALVKCLRWEGPKKQPCGASYLSLRYLTAALYYTGNI